MFKALVVVSAVITAVLGKWTISPHNTNNKVGFDGSYDEKRTNHSLMFAYSTYQPEWEIFSWMCKFCKEAPSFQLNDIHTTDVLLAFSGYDPVYNQVVFAFRGTANTQNWATDGSIVQIPYPGVDGGMVHMGFYLAWSDLRPQVLKCLRKLLNLHPLADLLITGHSLGSALAAVASLDMIKEADSIGYLGRSRVETFGGPRWCNQPVVDYFIGLVDVTWRVVNMHDRVPTIPFCCGYAHVPTQVWYTSDEPLVHEVCDYCNGEDPECAYPYFVSTWDDHTLYMDISLN